MKDSQKFGIYIIQFSASLRKHKQEWKRMDVFTDNGGGGEAEGKELIWFDHDEPRE